MLKDDLYNAVKNQSDYSICMMKLSKAFTDWINNSIKIQVSYAGLIPGTPPVADPIVTDVFSVSNPGATLLSSAQGSYDVAMTAFLGTINASLMTTLLSSGEILEAIPINIFTSIILTSEALSSYLSGLELKGEEGDAKKAWELFSNYIKDSISSAILNVTPTAGSNPNTTSTGTIVISSIIINDK